MVRGSQPFQSIGYVSGYLIDRKGGVVVILPRKATENFSCGEENVFVCVRRRDVACGVGHDSHSQHELTYQSEKFA